MEPLYAKLYDKYVKLKRNKFTELDQCNKEQEVKFVNYVNAAEELIQHLKNENDSLRAKVNELMAANRVAANEPNLEYQKLLMEEIQKNKELSQEVDKLRKLQEKEQSRIDDLGRNDDGDIDMPESIQHESDTSYGSSHRKRRKRGRPSESNAIGMRMSHDGAQDFAVRVSERESNEESMHSGDKRDILQPSCCIRIAEKSGISDGERSSSACLFQALIEYILGLRFSVVNQTQGIYIAALHESSGYSFSLTWVGKAPGGEVELMYNVLSLGTYERVAPEWMREVIKFSTSMCPVFFNRLARVIKMQHGTLR